MSQIDQQIDDELKKINKPMKIYDFSDHIHICDYCNHVIKFIPNDFQIILECSHIFHNRCYEMFHQEIKCPRCD